MFKKIIKYCSLSLLLLSGCSLKTTKSQISFVSRRYFLSFATAENTEKEISFVDIRGLFVVGWNNPPTHCDFHYDGYYEETIEYKKNVFEKENFSGRYVLNKNSKGQNVFSITRNDGTELSAYENWPYKLIQCPQPYNIVMGFEHYVYLSKDATEKSKVVLWYISNVFLPYDFDK